MIVPPPADASIVSSVRPPFGEHQREEARHVLTQPDIPQIESRLTRCREQNRLAVQLCTASRGQSPAWTAPGGRPHLSDSVVPRSPSEAWAHLSRRAPGCPPPPS